LREPERMTLNSTAKLIKIKSGLKSFPKFKGKAAMVRKVSGMVDFLAMYKTEPNLEALLVKEAEKLHGEAFSTLNGNVPEDVTT
jgi:hypothetical protein